MKGEKILFQIIGNPNELNVSPIYSPLSSTPDLVSSILWVASPTKNRSVFTIMMIQTTQFVKEPFDVKLSVVQWLEQLSNINSLASEALPPDQGGEIPYTAPDPQSNPPDPGGETPKIAPDPSSNPPDPGPETPKIAPDPSSNPPDPGPQDPK